MTTTKWEYAQARHDAGKLDPQTDWSEAPEKNDVGPFLREAGEMGWELCAVMPSSTQGPVPAGPSDLLVVFKRPLAA